ncbi:MAG: FkbM family methyltransferase [Rhodospirillaceae bacterium]|jgi:FkbM family methyltransferase|nr:FkbM family methyltransferase [Rhodospirillaceae bacterium]
MSVNDGVKKVLFHIVFLQIKVLQKLFDCVGIKHYIKGDFFEALLTETTRVDVGDQHLRFHTPNKTAKYRARLLHSKEPETIDWIRSFGADSIFWDVGANVGMYSLFAAKVIENIKVIAIEPSIESVYLLNRNIAENGLHDQVCCYPFALSFERGVNLFKHQRIDFGGSMNVFGVDFAHDGKPAAFEHQYQVFGFKADDLEECFGIPQPNYLKIDVDGIEHLVARGAKNILSSSKLKSILIELNLDFLEQKKEVFDILEQCGFVLSSTHPPDVAADSPFANTYNHIFKRV